MEFYHSADMQMIVGRMTKLFFIFGMALVGSALYAEELIDIGATLFCENSRKSIAYVSLSSRPHGINKINHLFYFTDGYPNVPVSDWSLTTSTRIESDRADLKISRVNSLIEKKVALESTPAICSIIFSKDLRKETKNGAADTANFSLECDFKNDDLGHCKTNALLEQKLKITSPFDSKTILPFVKRLTIFK